MNTYTNNSIFICIFVWILFILQISLILLIPVQVLFCQFLENGNRYKAEIFNVHLYFNKLSIDISHFDVAQNFTISTCLRMSTYNVFVNFLEEYNRYRAEIFNVNITFDDLSNDVSHFVVAQNFKISTCLRMAT